MSDEKHILVAEKTKSRLESYIGKETWTDGLEAICDFLEIHRSKFFEFKLKRNK